MTVWWYRSVRRISNEVGHDGFSGDVGDNIVIEDLDDWLGTA